jgi:hypothetical protein
MGHRYVFVAHQAPLFKPDPGYSYAVRSNGYDGQFAYYIALDPIRARFHVDQPNYRYARILYPMLARILSFGYAPFIPYMLIVINWLAISGGTLALCMWLWRRGYSPWLSLVYGLSPGLFICLHMDLVEPLAYGLVALAMYLLSYGGRHRVALAAVAFAFAVLARESTAVFPAVVALWLLANDRGAPSTVGTMSVSRFARVLGAGRGLRWANAGLMLGLSFFPFALYREFLGYWLGPASSALPPALYPRLIPFSGLFAYWPWNVLRIEVLVAVVVPSLICALLGIWAVRNRSATPEIWLLLANVVLFVLMLNTLTYGNIVSTARVTTGVLLAAVLCVPAYDRVTEGNRTWLWASTALWFIAFPSVISFAGRVPNARDVILDFGVVVLLWTLSRRRIFPQAETAN